MKPISIVMVCIVLSSIVGCNPKKKSTSKTKKWSLHFDEDFTIGNHQENNQAFTLALPTIVRTDSLGNIFISDHKSLSIRVFDAKGRFIRSIGKRGKGPGELINISDFIINHSDELIVFDSGNRRITRFSRQGKVLSTSIPEKGDMVWPDHSLQLDKNHYLLLRKLRKLKQVNNKELAKLHATVLHLYNGSFNHTITSFGVISSLMNTGSKFIQLYNTNIHAGNFCRAKGGGVWYVPGIYDGRIYKFGKTAGGWKVVKTLKGSLASKQAVTIDDNHSVKGAIKFTVFTGGGPYTGKIYSQELGVFTLADGRLVNFTSQLIQNQRMTRVEVFNNEGVLEGVGRLHKFTVPGTAKEANIGYIWKDNNDRFYIIDNRGEPTVRVGQIGGLQNIK